MQEDERQAYWHPWRQGTNTNTAVKTGTSLTWSTVPFSKIVVMSKEVLGRRRNIPVKNWNLHQWHRFTFGQKLHVWFVKGPAKFVTGQRYLPILSEVSPTFQVCHRSALPSKFVIGQPYLPILATVCTTCQVCQRSALPSKFVKGLYLQSLWKVSPTCQKGQPHLPSLSKVSPTCQVCQRSTLPAKFAKGQPYLPSLS